MAFYECFVDGASRGQGNTGDESHYGHGAIGVLIYRNKKMVGNYTRLLGRRSNNQAEYEAILHAVTICWSSGIESPIIYSDCKTAVDQINGNSQCNSQELLPFLHSINKIKRDYHFRVVHVPRSQVSEADALANSTLDEVLNIPEDKKKKKLKKRERRSHE
jgi:ribonuclease HI